jgi:hypothetical protein
MINNLILCSEVLKSHIIQLPEFYFMINEGVSAVTIACGIDKLF